MERVFKIETCAQEIINVLEKYHATIYDMDRVLETVKNCVKLSTLIHTGISQSVRFNER